MPLVGVSELRCSQVPLTVLHKTGLPLNGSHPALLTVYGAYGISLETGFEPERLVLLDRGWVVALAHVRGGGELGRRCNADSHHWSHLSPHSHDGQATESMS